MKNSFFYFPKNDLPSSLSLSLKDWQLWVEKQNLPSFNTKQIFSWIYEKATLNPELFSNLSLSTRELVKKSFTWNLPSVEAHLVSKDKSEKFLLKTPDLKVFEMVLMPYDNRVTLCISSQIGCKMGCTFCQTGKMGFFRNLSSGEILSQILLANQRLQPLEKKVTNVVFMGMGEPLDNYEEVIKACKIMLDPKGFNLSKSRITISTSGLIPEIQKLAQDLPVRLAISLHSAKEEKRSKMMPINRKYSLKELKEVLQDYPAPKRYGITFEYVMIQNENDGLEEAKELTRYLHGINAKVNLIPLNHFPGTPLKASQEDRLLAFQSYLSKRGIPAPIRYSRGQDISGGCGQLAAKRKEEVDLDPRVLRKLKKTLN